MVSGLKLTASQLVKKKTKKTRTLLKAAMSFFFLFSFFFGQKTNAVLAQVLAGTQLASAAFHHGVCYRD